jgi:hypothetical protein
VRRLTAALLGIAVLLAGCASHAAAGVTATAVASPTPLPVPLAHFTNPAYPYEMGYPEGWRPVTANSDSVKFEGPDGRQISVVAQAAPDGRQAAALPAYADQQVEALRQSTPGLIELDRSRVGLPNKQAGVEVDIAWGTAAAPHRALLLYVLDSGVGYTLRADAPATTFVADRRSLDAALRSFTLTPPD